MHQSKFTETQIVSILKEADAGRPVNEISEPRAKLVQGVACGLTKAAAAREAGYSAMTAAKKASAILHRPLVQSALTRALEEAGVTVRHIVQPYVDGLQATHGIKNPHTLEAKETAIPDIATRMAAADRIVELFGGIPKVGEATCGSWALNHYPRAARTTKAKSGQPVYCSQ